MQEMAPEDQQTALNVAVEAVKAAGRQLLELRHTPLEVLCEPGHDIKLRADQLAETSILHVLNHRMPLPVLTEESGEHGAVEENSLMWIVDPLDGTFNYSRGMPLCCSSVGLWANGEPLLGAVYHFFNDELFTGIVGQGAWLNGRPMAASGITEISKAALATGFPHHWDMGEEALRAFINQTQTFKKIRMLGSAALMGAFTACGWVDAYMEDDIWLWDIAAAAAIAKAAGAEVRLAPGNAGRWARKIICASSLELLNALEAGA
ncbi:MAG: inositol monophosphatase [Verrucomicrobiota bacterium]|jgi:myo-inositol-1(or 4)-monophosphatase|nr:inositol monophosphatase [Verrucomicrobiota bacterium]